RMLSNEKYKGDALLQKEFTVDFLQKKMKKNKGEVPQYYVEGNHEAIISPQVFDLVQAELERRKKSGSRYSGVSIFSNKIKCGDYGSWYGSKVWHSTDKYRKVVYRCNHKYDNGTKCETPHVTEDEIKAAFVSAYNKLVTEKKEIIANAELIRKTLCVTDSLLAEKKQLEDEMSIVVEMTQSIVEENARLKNFIQTLKMQNGVIREFDSALWGSMVEYITVGRKKEITVTFRNGTEILV
ncbi:MAG: recombinase family protein, partial [Clostridiales bacterium]|nr:recombinase family protein [Clostridiales bacterium]